MNDTQDAAPTPKVKRGSWHQWARDMRAQGYTYAQIAEAVGVSAPAVYFCVNPGKRPPVKKKEKAPLSSVAEDDVPRNQSGKE